MCHSNTLQTANPPRHIFGIVCLLNVLWTPVNFMVSAATNRGFSPAAVGLARWTSLALMMLLLLRSSWFRKITGHVALTKRDWWKCFGIGFFLFGPSHMLFYLSMGLVKQGLASEVEGTVILSTAPIFTGLLSYFVLHERLSARRVAAIALSFVGAYIVAVGFAFPSLVGHAKGNLTFGLGVMLECLMGVIAARISRRSSGVSVLSAQMLGGGVSFWVMPLLLPSVLPITFGTSFEAYLPVLYLIFISGLITFTIWYRIVESVPLTQLVVGIALQPPLAALIGWVFKGELPGRNAVIGGCVIMVALALGFLGKTEKVEAVD